jgi:hypothetical protein
MALITRSDRIRVLVPSHVCGWPSRTSVSMSMKCTQSLVTGRSTITASPTAKPAALLTVKELAPDGM